jgi:hypothetical protein
MSKVYLLDGDQLEVLQRVKRRLYNEVQRLTPDDRRDLANAMDAVLHNVARFGELRDSEVPAATKKDGEQ